GRVPRRDQVGRVVDAVVPVAADRVVRLYLVVGDAGVCERLRHPQAGEAGADDQMTVAGHFAHRCAAAARPGAGSGPLAFPAGLTRRRLSVRSSIAATRSTAQPSIMNRTTARPNTEP